MARPAQVCELLNLDASTLSRNVERMQAKGWLEVVTDEDGRSQPFRLTAQGRKLLEKAVPAWEEAQEQATALLGETGVEMLQKIARGLGLSAPKG
ncbi:MAG: MarR family winged helix-turn-helix transcriptional regulator [Gemmataceae bacterium]|nr:MarR family winged helix-turn-helix transcriptional regulator [Gemmataceae bacterium]